MGLPWRKRCLSTVVHDVIKEIIAAHPERKVEAYADEGQIGQWNAARISLALTNLVGNAVEHGAPGSTVRVGLSGGETDVTIMIHNLGTAIPADRLNGIFNPMKLSATPQKPSSQGPTGNLGLELYIAKGPVLPRSGHAVIALVPTRFRFTPRTRVSSPQGFTFPPPIAAHAAPLVLIGASVERIAYR